MATKTFYFKDAQPSGGASGARSLQDGGSPPTAATTATGWNPGKNAANQCHVQVGNTEVVNSDGGWNTIANMSSTLGTTDHWRSEDTINGVFAQGAWTITFQIRSVTRAFTGRCKFYVQLWKATAADGSSGSTQYHPANSTAYYEAGPTTANLSTSADTQVSVSTFANIPDTTFTDEYLFLRVIFAVTTAGANTTEDVLIRVGSTATVTSSDFSIPAALVPKSWVSAMASILAQ